MWYLCIGPKESTAVIASYYFFEPDYFDAMEYEDIEHEDLVSKAFFCAGTFTEFLYRFWVEGGAPTIVEGSRWWRLLTHGLPDFGVLVERLILSDLR